jgi:hypothetical protein
MLAEIVRRARRATTFTQAEIARTIRAAKQAGAAVVEVCLGDQAKIVIRLSETTTLDPPTGIIL